MKILEWMGLALFLGLVFVAFLFLYYSKDLPSPETLNDLFVPESTQILDRTETAVLYDIYGEQKRTIVPYEEMTDRVRWATIVAEDDQFYRHMGIDVRGIARALLEDIKGGEFKQGGSTITQQFIKNALLSPEKTLPRKIKEAILAIELELKYSKDEILTLYLNQVPYGNNAYGIEAAAQTYFGKHAKDLTLAESAALSAFPQAPTYYSNNREELFVRQKSILDRMLSFGYITQEEYDAAISEEVVFKTIIASLEAPHFVIEVKQYLEEKYGPSFVQQAGLKVVTTLDKTLQEAAESAVDDRDDYNLRNYNAHNSALVAIDPKTGQVLALVGSKDYFAKSEPEGCVSGKTCLFDPQVNIAVSPQQPGSSFKPFAYAEAFRKGYTPDTLIFDIPTEFNPYCPSSATQRKDEFGLGCYNPQNYDGKYYGAMTLKEAIAQSRNVPSVKVLYLAGVEDTIKLARDMGIESLEDTSRYGLSLVLGGGDITLLEETAAYGVFAARGERNPVTFILKVEDKKGNILEEYRQNSKQVLDKEIADQINYVLSVNELRAPVFGIQNHLTIAGLPVAAKTGTTQDYRDALALGYTQSLVAGVWTGNNNNTLMYKADGSQASAPIWNAFMRKAYEAKAKEPKELKERQYYFALPKMGEEAPFIQPITEKTGKPVLDGQLTEYHTILHYVSLNNPRGAYPSDPTKNPQYKNWEEAVRNWASLNNIPIPNNPGSSSDNPTPGSQTTVSGPFTISFLSPAKTTFSANETLHLDAQVNGSNTLEKTFVYINGQTLLQNNYGTGNVYSVKLTKDISLEGLQKNTLHQIMVEVRDSKGNIGKAVFVFRIE